MIRTMLRCLLVGPVLSPAFLVTVGVSARRPLVMATSSTADVNQSGSSSLKDKVFLVTGSTDGIGRHTASRLAGEGATVFVHGRREFSVCDAVAFIKSKGNDFSKVEGLVADISTLRGMNKLCDDVLARTDRLDCLINNAGVFEANLRRSEDGLEYTFAVNVMAPCVITGRLLGLIARAPDGGRVVNVASTSASSSVDFDNLQFEKGSYSDHAAYSLSKILDIMFNAELARRAPDGVTCNSLDPGTVNTKMLFAGWGPIGIPVERANDQFYLATNDGLRDTTGEYFVSRRVYILPPPARDVVACRRLWEVLQELSGFGYNA